MDYKPRQYFEPIVNALKGLKRSFAFFEIAGSYRRGAPTMKDVDVVCLVERPEQSDAIKAWIETNGVRVTGGQGFVTANIKAEYKVLDTVVRCESQVDFKIHYDFDEWPSALLHFTGSKEHNIMMRSRAKKYGFKLNEYGLWLAGQEDERVLAPSEAEIFHCLGMTYVPPDERG